MADSLIAKRADSDNKWLLRVTRHQMFVDPSRVPGNQTAILIEAEQDHPIVNRTRPFATRQKVLGLSSERSKEVRDVRVTPADENHFSLLVCTQICCQIGGLSV